jgi:hypothetical protein
MSAEAKKLQLIEIVGGYTRCITQIVDKETTTEEFIQKLMESTPIASGIIPAGCVFYKRSAPDQSNSPTFTYIFEYPAGRYKLRGISQLLGTGRTEVEMFMPNLLLACSFKNGGVTNARLFCTKAPLRVDKGDTMLYYISLPNQYGDGRMCFGQLQIPVELPVEDKADTLYKWLFTSIWNQDLMPQFPSGWSWRDWMGASSLEAVLSKVFYLERGTFDKIINNAALLRATE